MILEKAKRMTLSLAVLTLAVLSAGPVLAEGWEPYRSAESELTGGSFYEQSLQQQSGYSLYGKLYDVYLIELSASDVYRFEVVSDKFDTYIEIREVAYPDPWNPARGSLYERARDDDSGDDRNSQLDWSPPRSGMYEIIVTHAYHDGMHYHASPVTVNLDRIGSYAVGVSWWNPN